MMGSLFRSEDMVLCQMYLQADAAYSCVSQLGELGIVQFKDLNEGVNMFQRQFVSELRRCEEMERQLRFFERELKKSDIVAHEPTGVEESPAPRDIVDLEATFESMEADLKEMNNGVETLERNLVELQELHYVLQYTDPFFAHGMSPQDVELSQYDHAAAADSAATPSMQLRYLAGVIPMARLGGFMRLLWFASHGNIFVRHVEIEEPVLDPHTGEETHKVVFLAVFQGDQLRAKVRKICEGYKATVYPCPEKLEERREMLANLGSRIADLQIVLNKSKEQRHRTLQTIAHHVRVWTVKVLKLKAVYMVMNKFLNEGQNYVAECWLPYSEYGNVQAVLQRASELAGSQVSSLLHPILADQLPTYHRLNKFTRAFQVINDAYGVACYKEVNPAAFSVITFPFLFSVMFGDAGHGLLLALFAAYMILRERHLIGSVQSNEIFRIIFGGRYIILLMGLFSVYSGLIYNDVFSKSFNIFGSKWHSNYSLEYLIANKDATLDASNSTVYGGVPYEFGVDPAWQLAENKIMYTNSFKKKISVIFGVSQMLLGVMLSLWNHVYFKHYLSVICVFIPQVLFLLAVFGYLCALIFVKWVVSVDYPYIDGYYSCSPNLLIGFINMFMFKYPDDPCSSRTWYPGQKILQSLLFVVVISCAFWLLLSKPLILLYRHKRQHRAQLLINDRDEPEVIGRQSAAASTTAIDVDTSHHLLSDDSVGPDDIPISQQSTHRVYTTPIPAEEEFVASEVFIHQGIHTIEFCLGCISHTASYLRLWALSLAHAELSEVLWQMVMRMPFTHDLSYFSGVLAFVIFAPFAVLTVVILLIMEGLSAFLHTLRLHWVEFNSKFYKGEGMQFEPFSFDEILSQME